MTRLAVNGRFFAADVTGVQRFAREVTARLGDRVPLTLLLPRGVSAPAANGRHGRVLHGRLRGHFWEQIEAPSLAAHADADVTLHMSGTMPLRGGTHVVTVHDVLPLTNPEWFSWRFARWYRFVLTRAVPRAAAVLTVSEWSKHEIVRTLGIDEARVHVVLQGIGPFHGPAPASAIEEVRAKWSLPDRFVLLLGGGDPRKNVSFGDDVKASWARRWEGAPHVVVAGGAVPRVYGRPRRTGSYAQWLGRVSDAELQALYTAAAVVLCPSKAEGFGRTPLEAAACGTPSIVAAHPSAKETIGDGAQLLPLDAARWAEALYQLVHERTARETLLAAAQRRVASMNWDACAARVLEVCMAAARSTVTSTSAVLRGVAGGAGD